MGRVYNNERRQIVKELIDPTREKLKKLLDLLNSEIDKICLENTPDDVKQILVKYPGLLAHAESSVYIGNFSWGSSTHFSYLRLNNYIPFFHKEILNNLPKKNETIKKRIESYNQQSKEIGVLEKKLTCVLEHITTEKKLKKEFPEAYTALLKIRNTPVIEEDSNLCDSIENVRASLAIIK